MKKKPHLPAGRTLLFWISIGVLAYALGYALYITLFPEPASYQEIRNAPPPELPDVQ